MAQRFVRSYCGNNPINFTEVVLTSLDKALQKLRPSKNEDVRPKNSIKTVGEISTE